MGDTSLVNFGELSKPATVLIEKISDAIGGAFRPHQIVRVAKADARAEIIRAEAGIQISDLQRRAARRFLEEEAQKQMNIEEITQKALPFLQEESKPEEVEDDWITNFFDKCRLISNDEMQKLWSSVLAGEANKPGAFSKRTVNLLADLDRSDAELFVKLCGFCWDIEGLVALIYDEKAGIYVDNGVSFDTICHLQSLGLLQFGGLSAYARLHLPRTIDVNYYGRALTLEFEQSHNNSLELGKVLLTQYGRELASICCGKPIESYFEYIYDLWANASYVPMRMADG